MNSAVYQKAYAQTESGKKARRKAVKKYRQNHPGKIRTKQTKLLVKYRLKYPEKEKAHTAVYRAVHSGNMRPSVFCESCGLPVITQAHHADYSRVLSVDWLCQTCHTKIHVS
ncbi:hypothetical protein LCGC14_2842750 [marine sediment metagenome]|uniref:Uncharacterized protein n=1 Tax=marine sediment metagenome TaxID=412755 RepID=A0A0F8YXG2_9ZZZZ